MRSRSGSRRGPWPRWRGRDAAPVGPPSLSALRATTIGYAPATETPPDYEAMQKFADTARYVHSRLVARCEDVPESST